MSADRHLTARQAAAELGIAVETLYAYVSRGMLRSDAHPDDPRARRYPRADVERLRRRKELRRDPAAIAPEALHWGAPVLESAITLIEGGRLYFRGHDAVALAREWSFEEVAALLWTGERADADSLFRGAAAPPAALAPVSAVGGGLAPVERCQLALVAAGAADLAALDLRAPAVAACGARILRLLAAAAAEGADDADRSIPALLQAGWAPRRPEAADPIRAALILCADHELNASAFTARCAASAAATPYDAVAAALATLKGGKHGGHVARVEALFAEAGTPAGARRALADRLRRGEAIPGFGHPLYPDGDPRGVALLDLTDRVAPDAPAVVLAAALREAVVELVGERPTLDFALVTLARALALPAGSPLALFALGRTAGWIAHAREQYALDRLIRPRARYVGPPAVAGE